MSTTNGFDKACYSVNQTLHILSIGRTSLYALVKRGDLTPLKIGKKTLFTAENISELLNKLRGEAAIKPVSRSSKAKSTEATASVRVREKTKGAG
jgi:hypothetical protein